MIVIQLLIMNNKISSKKMTDKIIMMYAVNHQ